MEYQFYDARQFSETLPPIPLHVKEVPLTEVLFAQEGEGKVPFTKHVQMRAFYVEATASATQPTYRTGFIFRELTDKQRYVAILYRNEEDEYGDVFIGPLTALQIIVLKHGIFSEQEKLQKRFVRLCNDHFNI